MNIAKALKVKNRLVGDIKKYQEIAYRENSRRSDNPSKINVEEVFTALNKTRMTLVQLKTAIVKASAPIAYELTALAEVKQILYWISTIPTREGDEKVSYGMSNEPEVYKWVAHVNREKLDMIVIALQQDANDLQDKIDDFNATTQIDEFLPQTQPETEAKVEGGA